MKKIMHQFYTEGKIELKYAHFDFAIIFVVLVILSYRS